MLDYPGGGVIGICTDEVLENEPGPLEQHHLL